jgi:hypothetical protein
VSSRRSPCRSGLHSQSHHHFRVSPALTLAPTLVVLVLILAVAIDLTLVLASSPSTSCCHIYHSHLGCCLCAVAVVVMALPSSSPCRIRLHCRCLCCHLHHRRVVARHYPHSCHYPHPLCSRPHHRHHRHHCPSSLPLLSVRLTVALASHFMQIPAPRIMLALAPGLMRVLIACLSPA